MAQRVTQVAVETIVNPNDANVRVTQVAAEVLFSPTTAIIHLTQVAVEVLMLSASSSQPICMVIT